MDDAGPGAGRGGPRPVLGNAGLKRLNACSPGVARVGARRKFETSSFQRRLPGYRAQDTPERSEIQNYSREQHQMELYTRSGTSLALVVGTR